MVRINTDLAVRYFEEIGDTQKALKAVERGFRLGNRSLENRLDINLTGRILNVQTGTLRRSAVSGVSDPRISRGKKVLITYGSNVEYAAAHEVGSSHEITPKNAGGVLAFEVDGEMVFAKRVTVNIPARMPFQISGEEALPDYVDFAILELIAQLKQERLK